MCLLLGPQVMEVTTPIWYLLLTVLILNASLSILGPRRFSPTQQTIGTRSISHSKTCCSCASQENEESATYDPVPSVFNKKANYQDIANSYPILDPSYRTTTLTRLGTDLHFDLLTCPEDSLMRKTDLSTFEPEHLDCPTLFIVGARKGGTSSLYHYVSKHPDFQGTRLDRGPKVGETFYFSSKYDQISWTEYLASFPSDGVMTGESSVGNLVSCKAPARIFKSCGKQAKIVMLLRNPVSRFESNFLMRVKLGSARTTNTTSISTVLNLHLDRLMNKILRRQVDITKLPTQWSLMKCYFEPAINMVYEGLYYVHLLNWLCNFPPENVLILNSEEFYSKPSMILDQVYQFLGLKRLDNETYNWITSNVYNQGQYNISQFQTMSVFDKKKLVGFYESMNKALFSLLDWNNMDW